MNRFLKAIHNFILHFGINISFVKKDKAEISALEHNTSIKMNDFYQNENNLKQYLDPARLDFYKKIIHLFIKENISLTGKTVADVGCGTGHLLKYISTKMRPAYSAGFDFSEVAIEVAKTTFPEAQYQVFDLYNLLPKKFDVIVCTEVLEHLLYPDRAMNNLIEMLNPNGVLLLTVPNGRVDTYNGHINFWSPESWEIFLKENALNSAIRTGSFNEHALWGFIFKNVY